MLLLSISTVVSAQKNKTLSNGTELDILVYSQAIAYNDVATAINSLHHIIAKEGAQSLYKDSLALLYFNSNNYLSSYLLSTELLEKKATDLSLLEINALSIVNLGDNKKAVTAFEKLFSLSKNQYHGYQLASIQLGLKRFGEAQLSIEQSLQCTELKDMKIQFPIDKQQYQQVPIKAALFNLKGMAAYQLKDNQTALKSFEQALLLFPDFFQAKQNKEAIESEMKKTK